MLFEGLKRTICTVLLVTAVVSMVACSGGEVVNEDETEEIHKTSAASGGSISLPEGFQPAEEAGSMITQLTGGQMYGSFNAINSKKTKYFSQAGSLTITIQGQSSQEGTKWTDAFISLWKKGEDSTEFIAPAIHFELDASPYTYTFEGLDPAAEYRIGITYNDVPRYRMTGTFVIDGITGEDAGNTSADS